MAHLTNEQLLAYERNGYLLLPSIFSTNEMDCIRAELPALFTATSEQRVVENDGALVRSVYGAHLTNKMLGRFSRDPRLVCPAEQILDSAIYIYQFKINAKAAFAGDIWEWHQDFIFWRNEDGMPGPRAVNAVVFLDEVTEFNAPIFVIPGSHKSGTVESHSNEAAHAQDAYGSHPAWISNLTATLKYSIEHQIVAQLAALNGIVSMKGPPGSLLFFHCNLFHASSNNISHLDRAVAIATYNSTENIPIPNECPPRPDFLCSRDFTPLTASTGGLAEFGIVESASC